MAAATLRLVARPFEPKHNPDADLERRARRLSAAHDGFDVHCAVRIAAVFCAELFACGEYDEGDGQEGPVRVRPLPGM